MLGLSSKVHFTDKVLLVQVSIAKQLKSTLGIEDSTKIGFLVHVSTSPSNNVTAPRWLLARSSAYA